MLETPIFHVNGDDPEAVVFVTRLALAYRQRFRKDVVIDLVCYRRHGHNEADEPSATQPVMYQTIRKHLTTRKLYADKLVAQGVITDADAAGMTESYRQGLDEGRPQARASLGMIGNKYTVDWSKYLGNDWTERVKGGGNMARLKSLGERIVKFPEDFALHPRVAQVMANRVKMLAANCRSTGAAPRRWPTPAFSKRAIRSASPARMPAAAPSSIATRCCTSRPPVQRYIPLQHIAERQPSFQITDSVLSEEAVLGFEYGYSTTDPSALVIWEGQFGDFVNGAQVIIDQFISSGEAKWGRLCGLALFLPHGYEGQGPEHSSARLERFLQLCAENNMQVCVPSTPAQMYHMIRRQILRSLRKPLIVMTPKSLLRHELSVSSLEDLANGEFANVIDEVDKTHAGQCAPRRVVVGQGVLRPAEGASCRRTMHTKSRWCASSSSIHSRCRRWKPCSRSIRTRAKSCGARKSRRTRAPGTRSAIGSRRSWASANCCTQAALRPPRRPPASARCTKRNSAGSSKRH